jgi:hypothetical protein
MLRNIYILIAVFIYTSGVNGQSVFQPKPLSDTRKGILYDKEVTFDVTLHTNGYAFGVTWGNIATYYKTNFWYVGLGEIKHPKEHRQNFRYFNQFSGQTSNSFVYGKQNNLFLLRAGKGIRRYYSEKAKEKGVAVGLVLEGGPTLGMLKPYYLELRKFNDNNELVSEKYSEENADLFLNVSRIFGSSGLARGLDEIRLVPGLHGKVALSFEWGAYDEFIKSAEVGMMLDVFPRVMPIMVTEGNRPFFLNLFITLQLGKRS